MVFYDSVLLRNMIVLSRFIIVNYLDLYSTEQFIIGFYFSWAPLEQHSRCLGRFRLRSSFIWKNPRQQIMWQSHVAMTCTDEKYNTHAVGKKMASIRVAKEIQDSFLTCTICLLPFTKPKALPCLHTFCEGCLGDFIRSRYERTGQFPCPICRQVRWSFGRYGSLKTCNIVVVFSFFFNGWIF